MQASYYQYWTDMCFFLNYTFNNPKSLEHFNYFVLKMHSSIYLFKVTYIINCLLKELIPIFRYFFN